MNKRLAVILGIAWALCAVGAFCDTAPTPSPATVPPAISGLLDENYSSRLLASRNVEKERSDSIKSLLAIAQRKDLDKTQDGPVYLAVVLLGELRATAAIKYLSDNIAYLPPLPGGIFRGSSAAMESYYPCAVSLTEIGEPCIFAMDYVIRMAKTQQDRNPAAWVMMQVEGKDVAVQKLDALVKKGGRSTEDYQDAEDFITNYKPVFRHPLVRPGTFKNLQRIEPNGAKQ